MPIFKGLIQEVKPPDGVTVEQNLAGFFKGAFIGNFSSTSFVPLANAKIHLAVERGILGGGFFPQLSLEADSRADGRFEIEIPEPLTRQDAKGFMVAYKQVGLLPRPNAAPIRLFEPIYRSEPFKLADIGEERVQIFGAPVKTADEQGIKAAAINAQIDAALAELAEENEDLKKLKELNARIISSGLRFDIEAAARTRGTFDLQLSPNTGASATDLDDDFLLRAKVVNVDISKASILGRICRSRTKLEAAISKQAKTFTKAFGEGAVDTIRATLAAQGAEGQLAVLLVNGCFSLTASAVRFPQIDRPGPLPGKEHVMVLDVSFGYPRQPVKTPFGCKLPELEE
jgi:hypothetical protein